MMNEIRGGTKLKTLIHDTVYLLQSTTRMDKRYHPVFVKWAWQHQTFANFLTDPVLISESGNWNYQSG